MEKAKVASKTPFAVEVVANKNYAWCSCGLSDNQPFCDGKHKGSSFAPQIVKFEEAKTVYFCGCKQTKNSCLCDGSHKQL